MRVCREVEWESGKTISELTLDPSEPCVVRGVGRKFGDLRPGSDHAVLDALRTRHGSTVVRVINGRSGQALGRYDPLSEADPSPEQCSMTEFLNSLRDLTSDRIRYANTLSVPAKLPDLGIPSELPELKGKRLTSGSPFLWVGSGGHHTGLHVDRHPNLNFLFCGQKKFWLLPPSLTSQLEIAPLFPDLRLNFRSRVDLREQINGKNSTLSEGCFGCQLGPSDAIYIPAYWWHAVDSNGINVALNYWWEEVTGHTFSSMLLAFSAGLYSFSDAPKSYRDAWFEIFAKLVFRQHGDPYLGLPVDEQGIAGTPNARSKEWLRSESIRCSERLKTICHFKQKTARYGLSEVGRKLDEKGELFLSRADQVLIDVFCKPRHLQDALDLAASSVGPGPALELLQNALEGALIEPQEYSNGKS